MDLFPIPDYSPPRSQSSRTYRRKLLLLQISHRSNFRRVQNCSSRILPVFSALPSSNFSFLWQVLIHPQEPRSSVRASQTLPENRPSHSSHRGRALPRKWGKLGAKPAARRESEPPAVSAVELVSPPTNRARPRSGLSPPSGGSAFGSEAQARRGAASP